MYKSTLATSPEEAAQQLGALMRQHAAGHLRAPVAGGLIEEARAEYIVFVDDDDLVATNYVACIISALQSQPDCVGLSMYLKRDGVPWSPNPVFRHSLKYRKNTAWSGNNRTPHHLCPVRREIAIKARFGDKDYGEDYDYALAILPHLKTEAMAAEHPIYLYDYRSKPACGC